MVRSQRLTVGSVEWRIVGQLGNKRCSGALLSLSLLSLLLLLLLLSLLILLLLLLPSPLLQLSLLLLSTAATNPLLLLLAHTAARSRRVLHVQNCSACCRAQTIAPAGPCTIVPLVDESHTISSTPSMSPLDSVLGSLDSGGLVLVVVDDVARVVASVASVASVVDVADGGLTFSPAKQPAEDPLATSLDLASSFPASLSILAEWEICSADECPAFANNWELGRVNEMSG